MGEVDGSRRRRGHAGRRLLITLIVLLIIIVGALAVLDRLGASYAERVISDRVAEMYLGQIMELGTGDDVYYEPQHSYTIALLSASPIPDPELELKRKRIILTGDVPSPVNPPSGCPFHPRCAAVMAGVCDTQRPVLTHFSDGRAVRCHLYPQTDAVVPAVKK